MRRASWIVALLALLVVGCAGDDAGGDADAPVRTDRVELPKSYRFEPQVIEVAAGTTVTWVNEDDFPHNVHLLDGSDTLVELPVGEEGTITFEEPGEIDYECSLHPRDMQGTVIVG